MVRVIVIAEAAKRITLEAIERECPHFKSWMDTLRALHQE